MQMHFFFTYTVSGIKGIQNNHFINFYIKGELHSTNKLVNLTRNIVSRAPALF